MTVSERPAASGSVLVADVVLDSRTAGSSGVYTYLASPGAARGQAWTVPLGSRKAVGWVVEVGERPVSSLGFPADRLRPLGEPVLGLDLPAPVLELVHETARQTLSSISVAISPAVPPGIRERLAVTWSRSGAEPGTLPLAQSEALRLVEERGKLLEGGGEPLAPALSAALRALAKKGLVERGVELRRYVDRRAAGEVVTLTPDEAAVEAFLSGPGRRKPAQAVVLMRLQGAGHTPLSVREVRALAGVAETTVRALLDAGLLVPAQATAGPSPPAFEPNADQQAAIEAVSDAVRHRRHEPFLLFGITGSGKTEVYLRCAAEALRMGRGVLYLLPEIALTAQTLTRMRERFGDRVALLHSNLSTRERMDNWAAVRQGAKPVVLGARSALFAPLPDIGLVVVDEEHEGSFKQESAPRYVAGPLAEHLARLHCAPVVFGSATPSIESFHRAQTGGMRLLRLPSRAASARLPEVETVDLREVYRSRNPSLLAPALDRALRETLERGEQAILFLNRRAYAPVLQCRECGHAWECPRCSVALAYHRKDRQLRCHHCGHAQAAPAACEVCFGTKVGPLGIGVQRVEETLAEQFPGARIARLDRDVARRAGALDETLAGFRAGSIDILVGTQLVAKGLDFPRVTLVGAVAADISLHVPDFRASERTFQLLAQVAGRAGRGERPGRVLVQTFQPGNVAVTCAARHDFEAFFEAEIEERRQAGYPPFVRLVNILVAGDDPQAVASVSAQAAGRLRDALPSAEVLGPADCALARLDGMWRRHVLVKLAPAAPVAPVRDALEGLGGPRARIIVDVDPATLS